MSLDPNDANGLDRFCTTLALTRPLFKVIREIEQRSPGNCRNPAIHVHSILKYRITYENPVCTFDVRLQPKDDQVFWFVEDNLRPKDPNVLPTPERGQGHRRLDNLQEKLKELFSSKGPGWFGTRNGMIAELDAIPDALRKLNECVLSCKMEGGYVAPPPLERPAQQAQNPGQGMSKTNGVQQGNQQQQQQQQQQQHQHQQQQARMQQQQQQQHQARQQQQGQQQMRMQQSNQRVQQPNGRQPQHMQNARQHMQHQQGRGGRPGQTQNNVIEID